MATRKKHLQHKGKDGLTVRQRRFALAYVQVWNGAEAARRAGYAEKSADVEASRLLGNAKVLAIIEQALDEAGMSAKEVLARLAAQARGELATNTKDTPKGEVIEHDTLRALEDLAKHHKLLTENLNVQATVAVNNIDEMLERVHAFRAGKK